MKLIIAGSRYGSYVDVFNAFYHGVVDLKSITMVVCGCCSGIDAGGERFARLHNISIECFPPNWSEHGKAAGLIRNRQMAQYADALLLIWDGKSKGSASMKREMKKIGKPVYEVIV